ncbi:MAG: DUF4445 domain-containing protein [Eubacterium sp.]|nr:DUF4445 domain-containing protein [Eubacterium sp.]
MDRLFAAIDLGTTTVEASLLRPDGSVAAKHGFLNPQRKYGSDVISRITWAGRHPGSTELRDCVIHEIQNVLQTMLSWQGDSAGQGIGPAVVTGNATMTSLLLGHGVLTLGKAPFTLPYDHTEQMSIQGIPCTVPAAASAFLGSDAVGGAWALPLEENELLMDLGTNGEMILRHDRKLYGASAACGPAFENCTRSQGIYGTTTISALSGLIRKGKIRGDGILPPEIAEEGVEEKGIRITSKVLHDIQLAVGAIYGTFSMLLRRAGIKAKDIRKIHLAGGFGFHLSLRDAVTIGLIPEILRDRIHVAGNTSLLAAEQMVTGGKTGLMGYDTFREEVMTLQFAGNPEYEEVFVRSMILQPRTEDM